MYRKRLLMLCLAFGLAVPAAKAQDAKKEEAKTEVKADEKKVKAEKAQVAHIKISGGLAEADAGESPFGGAAGGGSLRSITDRIKKAKTDARVKALYLQIENPALGLFSFAKIEELRRAIADFRSAGKPAFAYLESIGGLEYLIASACDTITIPESGEFGLTGLRIEMSFYKDLFANARVKPDFLTMGEAKGAADPYMRTDMSPENKKQYELVLDDLFDNGLVKAIATDRVAKKFSPEQVKKLIDTAPHTAKAAKEAGLIDTLAYPDAFEADMLKKFNDGKSEVAKDYGKPKKDEDTGFAAILKMMSPTKKPASKKPKIALIYAVGAIESGKGGGSLFGGETMGSTTMVEAIQQAEKDATVQAIVLRIDSPGGSALASDLIWNALRNCKKPVVASMGDVAASGGYYIAMGAKKVYAEPGTLTGSIGVLGGKLVLGDTMKWAGVTSQTLARGQNSGWSSTNTMFSESERVAIRKVMEEVYDQFLGRTVENRKAAGVDFSIDKLKPMAGGRIWTGRQALERGLVDKLGTLGDAVADAKLMAKMDPKTEPELLILPEPGNFLEKLLEGGMGVKQNIQIPFADIPQLREHFKMLEPMFKSTKENIWLMAPTNMRVK